jgi:Recombinase
MSAEVLERRGGGRPPCCPRELAIRIIRLRRQGLSYERIAWLLNDEGIPTPADGERWHKSSVDRLLHTNYAKLLLEEVAADES